jgi:hypothetical protein
MRSIAFLLLLIPVLSSSAAPVYTITSGTADLTVNSGTANETFAIAGPGFSFMGFGELSASPCTLVDPCPLGAQIPSALAELSSEDRGVTGTITIGGRSNDYIEGPGFPGGAGIRYLFNLSTPGTNPANSLALTGPFTATADFADPNIESGNLFSFTGSGTVTIKLNLLLFPPQFSIPPAYELQSMHFAFTSVPEPETGGMALAAISVLAIVRFLSRHYFSKSLP